MDQQTWQLLSAIAQLTSEEDHKQIVVALRGKILENVHAVNKGYVTNEEERLLKLGNINLLLHAIGLDSSQMSGF
jgi:DNA topoisomerase 2-associated protein PAT1